MTTDTKPAPIARRAIRADALLKVMAWGEPGAGKTRFALTFPAPLVIDLERGSEWYADESDFLVATPSAEMPPARLVKEVLGEVMAGAYPDRKTLVIDPITDYLDALEANLIEAQRRNGINLDDLKGLARAKAYAQIRDGIRERLDLLVRVPMHVVLVARAKNVWGKNDDGKMAPVERTYDAKDIVEYLCDVVLHLDRPGRAVVRKSRIAALPEILERPGFSVIAERLYRKPDEKPAPEQPKPSAAPLVDWMGLITKAKSKAEISGVRVALEAAQRRGDAPTGAKAKAIDAALSAKEAEIGLGDGKSLAHKEQP